MRIAVVGGGISGLVASWLLARHHDVDLFEAGEHAGGHPDTHEIEIAVAIAALLGFSLDSAWVRAGVHRAVRILRRQRMVGRALPVREVLRHAAHVA